MARPGAEEPGPEFSCPALRFAVRPGAEKGGPALSRGAGRARPPPHRTFPRAPPEPLRAERTTAGFGGNRRGAARRSAPAAKARTGPVRGQRNHRPGFCAAPLRTRGEPARQQLSRARGGAAGRSCGQRGRLCPFKLQLFFSATPIFSSSSWYHPALPPILRAPPRPPGGRFRAAGALSMSEPARQRPPRRGCARAPRGKEGARPGAA